MTKKIEDDDLGLNDAVARKTIMRMRKSNMLIQFPQDEYKPTNSKFSGMVKKRPLIMQDDEDLEERFEETKG